MRRLRVAGLFLAPALLFFPTQAGTAKPQPNTVKKTAEPVWTLAIGGPRVAYASGGWVHVWNVKTGATSVVKGNYSNAKHSVNAAEIAIAGKRVAWIKREQLGNTELPTRLYTALPGGSAHRLRRVLGYTDVGCGGEGGSQVRGLVSAGNVLAVSTWKADADGSSASNRRLDAITPTGLRTIATGPNTIVAAAADAGHIAVVPLGTVTDQETCTWAPPTSVNVYSTAGKLLRQIETGPGQVALSGKRLAVLTGTSTPVLDVYDWTTGALTQAWPVAPGVEGDFAVAGRIAVYSVYRHHRGRHEELHVLDLTTGKDAVLGTANKSLYRHLVIGREGLVYVVNYWYHTPSSDASSGKLVFVPMARLVSMVSDVSGG
jgi:hypothetical protein